MAAIAALLPAVLATPATAAAENTRHTVAHDGAWETAEIADAATHATHRYLLSRAVDRLLPPSLRATLVIECGPDPGQDPPKDPAFAITVLLPNGEAPLWNHATLDNTLKATARIDKHEALPLGMAFPMPNGGAVVILEGADDDPRHTTSMRGLDEVAALAAKHQGKPPPPPYEPTFGALTIMRQALQGKTLRLTLPTRSGRPADWTFDLHGLAKALPRLRGCPAI